VRVHFMLTEQHQHTVGAGSSKMSDSTSLERMEGSMAWVWRDCVSSMRLAVAHHCGALRGCGCGARVFGSCGAQHFVSVAGSAGSGCLHDSAVCCMWVPLEHVCHWLRCACQVSPVCVPSEPVRTPAQVQCGRTHESTPGVERLRVRRTYWPTCVLAPYRTFLLWCSCLLFVRVQVLKSSRDMFVKVSWHVAALSLVAHAACYDSCPQGSVERVDVVVLGPKGLPEERFMFNVGDTDRNWGVFHSFGFPHVLTHAPFLQTQFDVSHVAGTGAPCTYADLERRLGAFLAKLSNLDVFLRSPKSGARRVRWVFRFSLMCAWSHHSHRVNGKQTGRSPCCFTPIKRKKPHSPKTGLQCRRVTQSACLYAAAWANCGLRSIVALEALGPVRGQGVVAENRLQLGGLSWTHGRVWTLLAPNDTSFPSNPCMLGR